VKNPRSEEQEAVRGVAQGAGALTGTERALCWVSRSARADGVAGSLLGEL